MFLIVEYQNGFPKYPVFKMVLVAVIILIKLYKESLIIIESLCRESKDVLRRGVVFTASAVHRRYYTGCVDNRMTS